MEKLAEVLMARSICIDVPIWTEHASGNKS